MHAHDRHLARARSKAHMRDTSKDEARAFTRAVRRFGKALTHMAKGDIRDFDDMLVKHEQRLDVLPFIRGVLIKTG